MHTGWSRLRNKLYLTLFEMRQLLSDFIGDFILLNLIISLVNSFGEFDVSPLKEIGAALVWDMARRDTATARLSYWICALY